VVLAYFAAAATSISFFKALVNPQTVAFFYFTNLRNRQKSPGLETESSLNYINTHFIRFAITSFFGISLHPGTCSPSLKVVSNGLSLYSFF
jgi:hypothetical protein